ncbi:putative ergosterol biosynthetic protein 28-like protein [Frankliniella fusca]|uniref:Ergosterol biosynthetic protein 28-like protein n=1 Tax=Frankliniella fusca TaxID=407009 RepID=A0AAE1L734_9NEOP|nr:putative ergosterol biosynthetic protein 28-like protein [Frankliniella fusca]
MWPAPRTRWACSARRTSAAASTTTAPTASRREPPGMACATRAPSPGNMIAPRLLNKLSALRSTGRTATATRPSTTA